MKPTPAATEVLLNSFTNLLFMGIVVLVSSTTSVVLINENLCREELAIRMLPNLTVTTAISFTIFIICFIVDGGSSAFIIIMMFLSIILAVLQSFSVCTILGLFTKDRVFLFSVDIWYKAEQTTLLTGAAFLFFNIIILLVYVSYLAPTFTHHIRVAFYERQIDEEGGHFETKFEQEEDTTFTQTALFTETEMTNRQINLFNKNVRSTFEVGMRKNKK